MDSSTIASRARVDARAKASPTKGTKPRTGPIPSVPWRDLNRRSSLEDRLPLMFLLAFAVLAGIQLMLQG